MKLNFNYWRERLTPANGNKLKSIETWRSERAANKSRNEEWSELIA